MIVMAVTDSGGDRETARAVVSAILLHPPSVKRTSICVITAIASPLSRVGR